MDELHPGFCIAAYELVVDDDLLQRHDVTLGHSAGQGPLPATVFASQPFTLGPRTVPPRWKGALTESYRLSTGRPAERGEQLKVTTLVQDRWSDDTREYLMTVTTVDGADGGRVCTAEVVTCWFLAKMKETAS